MLQGGNIAKIVIAAIATATAYAIPLHLVSTSSAISFVKQFGYYAIGATCILFCMTLWQAIHKRNLDVGGLLRNHWPVALLISAWFIALNFMVERNFQILFDEHTLSSTAMNMHELRLAYAQAVTHSDGESVIASVGFVDKRPLLFPFLLSAIHSVLGYDYANVFLLNYALCALFFILVYAIINDCHGKQLACFGVLLLMGLPLIAQNASGGGYEMLNLCLIASLILSAIHYLKSDDSKRGLNFMILSAVMLANVRYESVLYVLVAAAVFALKSLRHRKIELSWFSAFSPLLLLLPLMTYALFRAETRFIQTTKDNFFSLEHLSGNLNAAIVFLFDWKGHYTNSILLSALGILVLVGLVPLIIKRARVILIKDEALSVLLIVFSIVLANTLLALICYWGSWTDPLASRFSLPLHLFFVLLFPFFIPEQGREGLVSKLLLVAATLYLILISPIAIRYMETEPKLATAIGYNWAMDWIAQQPADRNHLHIAHSALGFGLMRQGAIPVKVANAMPERVALCRQLGIYDEVYFFEILLAQSGGRFITPELYNAVSDRFELETTSLFHPNKSILFRISRLVRVFDAGPEMSPLPDLSVPPKPGDNASAEAYEAYFRSVLPLTASSAQPSVNTK